MDTGPSSPSPPTPNTLTHSLTHSHPNPSPSTLHRLPLLLHHGAGAQPPCLRLATARSPGAHRRALPAQGPCDDDDDDQTVHPSIDHAVVCRDRAFCVRACSAHRVVVIWSASPHPAPTHPCTARWWSHASIDRIHHTPLSRSPTLAWTRQPGVWEALLANGGGPGAGRRESEAREKYEPGFVPDNSPSTYHQARALHIMGVGMARDQGQGNGKGSGGGAEPRRKRNERTDTTGALCGRRAGAGGRDGGADGACVR